MAPAAEYAPERVVGELKSPTTFAVSGEGSVAWLEAGNGAPILRPKRGETFSLSVPARARAVTEDEKGQIIVLAGDTQTGYKIHYFRENQRVRSIDIKPSAPIPAPIDIAAGNEIVWILQQKPPLAVFFGSDGAELGRTDLTEKARAPFSIAVDHAGRAFITDPTGPAVLELNPYGQIKAVHGLPGSGFTRPTGIAAGFSGRIWISDTVLNEIGAFKESGQGLARDDLVLPLHAQDPLRLAVNPGELWVLQGWHGAVVRFKIE